MSYDLVIARGIMLNEVYGAYLWRTHKKIDTLITEPITKLSLSNIEETIKNKNILIVGGYYHDNMEPITASAKKVTVFCNSSDASELKQVNYEIIIAKEGKGFLTWTIDQLKITDPVTYGIIGHLDDYMYGFPSSADIYFQAGLHAINLPTNLDKLLTIKTLEDIIKTCEYGKTLPSNKETAQKRLDTAVEVELSYDEKKYGALVAVGDTHLVETCMLLAERSKSGVGILLRYDLKHGRTFFSCRVTKESSLDAGLIMFKLFKGGGSKSNGGASVDSLFLPSPRAPCGDGGPPSGLADPGAPR